MRFLKKSSRIVPTLEIGQGKRLSNLQEIPLPSLNNYYNNSPELQAFLQHRKLLMDEIPFSIEELQEHYENGYLAYGYGVRLEGGTYICERCGNQKQFAQFDCARCGEKCTYCRSCIMMGRVSECTPLLTWTGPIGTFEKEDISLAWSGALSRAQERASVQIVEAARGKRNMLVWAVCGAGKTEILFQGIESSLKRGERVCIATPRTDVVLELAPRLRNAFSGVKVSALYGGSEERHQQSPLIVSTTHQLFRYDEAFDLIVIDEVDAFPFSADKTLLQAVSKARKKESSLIYLTATPSKDLRKQALSKKLPYVSIPARFHRHPLPVPTFHWCGDWKKLLKKNKLPQNVEKWVLTQLQLKNQAFLFVPSVAVLLEVTKILKKINSSIAGVYSEDKNRKEKVQQFRDGTIPLLVTTTILERGVTVPNSQVAVLGAEDDIFTESSLVQIAGRVGRHPSYPSGEVVFFHYGKTEEMVRAKKLITKMNETAQTEGYLS